MNITSLLQRLVQSVSHCAGVLDGVSRGGALFFGIFSLLNLLAGIFIRGFDANCWWIDLRFIPAPFTMGVIGLSSLTLLWYGVGKPVVRWGMLLRCLVMSVLLATTAMNTVQYYLLIYRGEIHGQAVPCSLLFFILFAAVAFGMLRQRSVLPPSRRHIVTTLLIYCIGFPLVQIYCYGTTDYRRPADVIVVFGARAYADGEPSTALADRVRTACMLYHAGYAPCLIFS
ncbi:MAG TPA: hypothetical protein VHV83_04545 [Armatimonadota bacterium]|nr:hypothetical protein [Armatimonadota bacterium]